MLVYSSCRAEAICDNIPLKCDVPSSGSFALLVMIVTGCVEH